MRPLHPVRLRPPWVFERRQMLRRPRTQRATDFCHGCRGCALAASASRGWRPEQAADLQKQEPAIVLAHGGACAGGASACLSHSGVAPPLLFQKSGDLTQRHLPFERFCRGAADRLHRAGQPPFSAPGRFGGLPLHFLPHRANQRWTQRDARSFSLPAIYQRRGGLQEARQAPASP
jgi:hypothetical protein